MIFKRKITSLT